MKAQPQNLLLALTLLSTLNPQLSTLWAQGTAFTYQGRLNDGVNPAAGIYDLRFTIYDSTNLPGVIVAGPLTNSTIAVSNGLFTVALDFGGGVFTGADRWLEIGVRTNGAVAFATLTPRQKLTPTPYSITAGYLVSGGLAAGTYANAVSLNHPSNLFVGVFMGNGVKVTNVNARTLDGLSASNFWNTGGNAGTTPGTHFLGTSDNQPLEFKANGVRALRLEPTGQADAVNVVGGSPLNTVAAGTVGGTIAGGGGTALYVDGNRVEGNFSTIGGGTFNLIQTNSDFATIGGGHGSLIGIDARSTTIGGGWGNNIMADADYATICGGYTSIIGPYSDYSTICGGYLNQIKEENTYSTIAGGEWNIIQTNADTATISGGSFHTIQANSTDAVIGGGFSNTISGPVNTIGGGWQNEISGNRSTIGGGKANGIFLSSDTTISGGFGNTVFSGQSAAIGGGEDNRLLSGHTSIGGGGNNVVRTGSSYAAIGGGQANTIHENATAAFVGGGNANVVQTNADYASIVGGQENTVGTNASYATIPGGYRAAATHYGQAAYASGRFAANGDAQASHYILRHATTDAFQYELFLDSSSERMKVPPGSTWTFDILIAARSDTGNSAGYQIRGVIENVAGAVGASFQAVDVLREDVAAWDAVAQVDNANDALVIKVTGSAGQNVRWVASVRTVEVTF